MIGSEVDEAKATRRQQRARPIKAIASAKKMGFTCPSRFISWLLCAKDLRHLEPLPLRCCCHLEISCIVLDRLGQNLPLDPRETAYMN